MVDVVMGWPIILPLNPRGLVGLRLTVSMALVVLFCVEKVMTIILKTAEEIAQVISDSLLEIAERVSWEDVPGTTIESCGNYKDHSLHSAKEWAKIILEQGISDDPFERNVV